MSPFEILNGVDVSGHTEKKGNLTYLSWVWAWGELKKRYPNSYYTIYENEKGWLYHTDGKTCWVKTGVTLVDGETQLEHIEYLPVLNSYNKSIQAKDVNSFDVNKSIQRSLTKAIARHGLGLYIYAGEDLPERPPEPAEKPGEPQGEPQEEENKKQEEPPKQKKEEPICEGCGNPITAERNLTAKQIAARSKQRFGVCLCMKCAKDEAARLAAGGAA